MDILEAVKQMLSASGLNSSDIYIDASLFRSVGARTNIGLINADNLSIQLHVNKQVTTGLAAHPPHAAPPLQLHVTHEHTPESILRPTERPPASPRIVERQLFDVRNTFNFNPAFVFDEKKITINTVPIYFLRQGGRVRCAITDRNVTLCTETFLTRHGAPSISEGVFHRCEQPTSDVLSLKGYDSRVARLTSRDRGLYYRNGGSLLICVFPTAPRKTLPLGSDDGVFPAGRFGPPVLVCVARPSRRATAMYRIRSHFYVVAEHNDTPGKETSQ